MQTEKFSAVMGLLVPQVIMLITQHYPYDEMTATIEFYHSEVYAILEKEETKLWHFSPLTLFHMFDEEKKTGTFYISGGGVRYEPTGKFYGLLC